MLDNSTSRIVQKTLNAEKKKKMILCMQKGM